MKMPNFVWFYVMAVSFSAVATTVFRCSLAAPGAFFLLWLRKANYPDLGAVQRQHLTTEPLAM
jgi:hypothetical protein